MDEGKKKVSPSCSIFDDVFALADRSVCFYSVRARSVVQLGNGYIAVRSTAMRKTSTSVPVCLLLHPHQTAENCELCNQCTKMLRTATKMHMLMNAKTVKTYGSELVFSVI